MARRPPPPPRPRSTTTERLRRLEARHRERERPFDPEERYRETKPHHFAVNPAGWAWSDEYGVRVVVPGLTSEMGVGFPYLSGGWEAAQEWAAENGVELQPGEPIHTPESLRQREEYEPNPRQSELLAAFFQWLQEVDRLVRQRSGETILDLPELAPEEAFLYGIAPEVFVGEAFG